MPTTLTTKKENTMWKAKLKDGKEVSELNTKWDDIKGNIAELLLLTQTNQTIYLPKGMDDYIQFKTASAELNSNSTIQIESRTIGYKKGSNIVKVRVNEKNNNITIESE